MAVEYILHAIYVTLGLISVEICMICVSAVNGVKKGRKDKGITEYHHCYYKGLGGSSKPLRCLKFILDENPELFK